jgi:hypothetical protein
MYGDFDSCPHETARILINNIANIPVIDFILIHFILL